MVRSVCIRYRTCTSLAVVWCSCNTVVHVRVIVVVIIIVVILLVSYGSLRIVVGSVMPGLETCGGNASKEVEREGQAAASKREERMSALASMYTAGCTLVSKETYTNTSVKRDLH